MKLKMSLPESPGWIFVVPGFDFIALLLALVMLTGVVAREGWIEVNLAPSEFRGVRMGDEDLVIVILKSTENGPAYYLANTRISKEQLAAAITTEAEKSGIYAVGIQVDERATTAEQQELINLIAALDYRVYLGVRTSEIDRKDGG